MSVIVFSPIIRLLVCVCWRNRRKKNNCTQEPWNKAHFCHSSVANPMDDINFFVVAALLVCGYTSSLDKQKTPRNIICQTREYSRRIPIHRMIHSQVKTSVFFLCRVAFLLVCLPSLTSFSITKVSEKVQNKWQNRALLQNRSTLTKRKRNIWMEKMDD